MSLILVSTPIGHLGDITLRGLEALKTAELIIGEDKRVASTLLKRLGVTNPAALPQAIEELNEHSTVEDISRLADLCIDRQVALVTDCGTPGFADPGAHLAEACRKRGIPVSAAPGASSLMAALTLSGLLLERFVFVGFLPQDQEQRRSALESLRAEGRALVFMDTPYRLGRLLAEVSRTWPNRPARLVVEATQPGETVDCGPLGELALRWAERKAEFVLIVETASTRPRLKSHQRRPASSSRRN